MENEELKQRQSRDSEAILQDYISQSRQAGKSDYQIRQELLGAGWENAQINELLKVSQAGSMGKFHKYVNRFSALGTIILWIFWLALFNSSSGDGFGLIGPALILLFFSVGIGFLVAINIILSLKKFRSVTQLDKVLFFISLSYMVFLIIVIKTT